jgi:uncharacterized membrane protein
MVDKRRSHPPVKRTRQGQVPASVPSSLSEADTAETPVDSGSAMRAPRSETTESSASQQRIVLALWFIAILYLLSIDLKGAWSDEGYRYILLSGGQSWSESNRGSFGSFSDVITAVRTSSQYVPLFYLIDNAVIRVAKSHSDLLLRMVNLIWLILGLQGLLRLFRNYSEATRLFAMFIFALNGFMLMHIMQIREYPLYLALQIWSSCLLMEILELPPNVARRGEWPLFAGYGALMGLFFYTQPYAVFTLAAQVVMALARKKNVLGSLREMALSYVIAAAAITPWVILRLRSGLNVGQWDTRPHTFAVLFESLKTGFGSLLIYNSWTGHPLLQSFVVVVVVGIPLAWIFAARSGEAPDRRAVYALLTCTFFFIFQVAYFFLDEPLSVWPRYFVGYSFGYVVLATCAFAFFQRSSAKRNQWYWRGLSPVILTFACISGLQQVRLYRDDPFFDTSMSAACTAREISQAMLRHIRPDETVVYYNPLLAWTINVSYPLFPNELSYSDVTESSKLAGKAVLWVLDTGAVRDYTEQTIARLRSAKYAITTTADLGCGFRLYKLEQLSGARRVSTEGPQQTH